MISGSAGTGLVCALTFDDGPNGQTTSRLLDFLGARDIRAVFCVIGSRVRDASGAELLRRMVGEGHLIANHSMNHPDLGGWSRAAVREELEQASAAIREVLDDQRFVVPYFRAPYGSWGESESVAAELGMRSLAVVNTIDDWSTQDPETLTRNLRAAMRPGELVLAHDGGGDRDATVDAVIRIVTERLVAGWTFSLPLDEAT